jgi:predicted ATPase/class 3 adenylate cyclase
MSHEPSQTWPGVILTPDQRIRVFISSTLEELAAERAAARRAIQRLHLVPVWYESGARPHPPRSMYRAYLEQSQVFVGIYWQRYGWVAPGMEISGLEDEYRLAAGKPMLLYLKRPAPDQEPGLTAMIDSIRSAGAASYRHFTTARELERLLVDDLAVLLSESFADATISTRVASPSSGGTAEAELPDGTVTFLFTDIEGSTRLWETESAAMARALVLHNETLHAAFAHHGGVVFSRMGDGMAVAFSSAVGAVRAALEAQRGLMAAPWPAGTGVLKVRMGLHTDEAVLRHGQYVNQPLNRCARLMAAAHGGQILMSDVTEALVRSELPDRATLLDLGEHRLRDLASRMHIFQLVHPDLPRAFPMLRTLDAIPNNLPIQLTELVGRQAELAEAEQLLTRTRLLTILAPGGAGKTRLAIQAAADIASEFPDGVFFISLADIRSDRDIVQATAESMGIALASDEDVQTQLLTYVTNKRQLLVFDNFEHLLAGASIITGILQAAPQVRVMITSRAKLNVTGETVFTLAGLETTWDSPAEAFQVGGVQLFIDAARRVPPRFVLEPSDLDPLAKILHLTGGLPLGILLAAAWVDMLPVSEIATEIAKNLDFLETDISDVPDRHRSLRAAFDYSWALLGPEERKTFLALSVFRGGFSREAAEAVAGGSLRGLSILVNKSLVMATPETRRYALHELLRQYAEAELRQDPEFSTVSEAHAAFYAALMEESFTLFTQGDQPGALRIIEQDLDNVRSAWRHYLATGNAAAARPFVEGLYYLYEMRGWYPAAINLFGEALGDRSDGEDAVKLRALAGAAQGSFLALIGQPDAGEAMARVAEETLRDSPDLAAYITCVQCLALTLSYLGRIEEVAASTEAAMAAADAAQHPFSSAAMRNWRAYGAFLVGDVGTATKLLHEAYGTLEQLDEHYLTSWNLWIQAMIATQQHRPQDAIDLHTRGLARCRDLGYLRGTMVELEGLGEANVAAGRYEAAEQAFIEGVATADKMGMVKDMLALMTKIAKVRAVMGLPVEAVEMLATVLAQPISAQQPLTDNTPIKDSAARALDDLRDALGPEERVVAFARGTSTPFEVAAKDLIARLIDAPRDRVPISS